MEIVTKVRKCGSSLAVVLPKKLVKAQRVNENDELTLLIEKRPLAGELFGRFPQWKRSAQQIKNEMRKGWKD